MFRPYSVIYRDQLILTSKHLAIVVRKNFLLTGRDLKHNLAQWWATIWIEGEEREGERKGEGEMQKTDSNK